MLNRRPKPGGAGVPRPRTRWNSTISPGAGYRGLSRRAPLANGPGYKGLARRTPLARGSALERTGWLGRPAQLRRTSLADATVAGSAVVRAEARCRAVVVEVPAGGRRIARLKRSEFRDTKLAERLRGEASQRRAVRARSGLACEFERFADGAGWARCGLPAGQTAHVHRRWRCGSAKYHPDAAVDGCGVCHPAYDSRLLRDEVRVPEERLLAADLAVFLATGKPPDGRPVPAGHAAGA